MRESNVFIELNKYELLLEYIVSHENYSKYREYLFKWKEELNECSKDRAQKISDMFGLPYIGHGDRRVCLYKNNIVAKLPLESCHYDSNDNENYLYEFIKDNYPSYLCHLNPIMLYKEGIIFTELCDDFDYIYDDNDLLDMCDDLRNKFQLIGIDFTDLDGISQIRMLSNDIVIVDYEDYEINSKLKINKGEYWNV